MVYCLTTKFGAYHSTWGEAPYQTTFFGPEVPCLTSGVEGKGAMPENGQRQLGLTGGSAGACPCCPEVRQPSRAGGRILAWLRRGCRVDEEACRGEDLRVGATGPEECGALVDSAGDETKVILIS